MKNRPVTHILFALALCLLCAGPACAASRVQEPDATPLLESSMLAGDSLSRMLQGRLGPGMPVLATSLVDLEDLSRSSPMGRLIAQQIASRLGANGYMVLDARLRGDMRLERKSGEFMLSRDTALLKHSYPAEAALVGTYSRGPDSWYISMRVLRLADSAILAACEYALPLDEIDLGDAALENSGVLNAEDWQRYGPRQTAFGATASPAGAPKAAPKAGSEAAPANTVAAMPPARPGWKDPAGLPQLKPLKPIKKK